MFVAKPRAPANRVSTVPAPIGGLNARDSLAAMPPTDAVIMRNFWPQPYGCSVRKGYREHVTGLTTQVDSLAVWNGADGTSKMFGWAGADMYDVSSSGAVGAAIVTTLASSVWQSTSISNSGGSFLIAVNGTDDAIGYRAAGVYRIVAGDGIVANTWAGIDPQDAIQLTVHQGRLWAVVNGSSVGYYLPVGAIQGTFVAFDFGPLFSRGGYLQYLSTWTLDDGNGAEDHLVAVSSAGEVAVYAGTDPSDSTKWALVGVYFAGAPVSGHRSFCKVGGDMVLITQRGVVSLTNLLVSTKVNESRGILKSDKIQLLISYAVESFSDLPGWQLIYAAPYNMLIVNVPSVLDEGNIQFASNQLMPEEPWTQFTGMDAASLVVFNNLLYFGNYDGTVYQAWYGGQDSVDLSGTNGTDVVCECQQAYSYLDAPSVQKQVGMYRPNFITNIAIGYNSRIDYDFITASIETPTPPPPDDSGSLWGTALWGVGVWSGSLGTDRQWNQADGVGVAAALRIAMQTSGEVVWVSTDYSYKIGRSVL